MTRRKPTKPAKTSKQRVRLPFEDKSNQRSSPNASGPRYKRLLRTQTKKDYLEKSFNASTPKSKPKSHIPIYLQSTNRSSLKGEKKSAVYEFVDDNDCITLKGKRRKKVLDESYKPPNKSTKRNKRNNFFYDGHKIKLNIPAANIPQRPAENVQKNMQNLQLKTAYVKIVPLSDELVKYLLKNSIVPVKMTERPIQEKQETMSEEKQKRAPDVPNLHKNGVNNIRSSFNDEIYVNSLFDDTIESIAKSPNGQYFGFLSDTDNESIKSQKTPSKTINIISNVLVKSSTNVASPRHFNHPNANSTFINKAVTPWRANLPVKSNPHLLQVKKNALPNVNQEIILNSSIVEGCSTKNVSQTASKVEPKKNLTQTSLDSYVGKNVSERNERTSKVELHESSLFDTDKYSPLKISQEEVSEEAVGMKPTFRVKQVKRKILCEITSDNIQISKKDKLVSKDIECCFGFDSVSEDKENVTLKKQKTSEAAPRRIPVTHLVDVMKGAKTVEANKEQRQYISSDEESNSKRDVSDDDSQETEEIRLFEDISMKPVRQSYGRKAVRRKRHLYQPTPGDSDGEENSPCKRKKRKDARTVEEELAAEKWATEFNKMCDEVEKYKLEIE